MPEFHPAFPLIALALVFAVGALMLGERGTDEWVRHVREIKRKKKVK